MQFTVLEIPFHNDPKWQLFSFLFFLAKLFSFGRLLSQLDVMIPSYYYGDSSFPIWSHSDLIWKPLGTPSDSSLHADVLWGSFVTHSLPQRTSAGRLLRQLLWPCHFNIGCLFGPITLTVNYSFFLYGRLNVIVIPLPFHYEGSLDPLFYYFNKLWDALFSLTTLSANYLDMGDRHSRPWLSLSFLSFISPSQWASFKLSKFILVSKAEGNKTKEMNFWSLNLNAVAFVLYFLTSQPWENFNNSKLLVAYRHSLPSNL